MKVPVPKKEHSPVASPPSTANQRRQQYHGVNVGNDERKEEFTASDNEARAVLLGSPFLMFPSISLVVALSSHHGPRRSLLQKPRPPGRSNSRHCKAGDGAKEGVRARAGAGEGPAKSPSLIGLNGRTQIGTSGTALRVKRRGNMGIGMTNIGTMVSRRMLGTSMPEPQPKQMLSSWAMVRGMSQTPSRPTHRRSVGR